MNSYVKEKKWYLALSMAQVVRRPKNSNVIHLDEIGSLTHDFKTQVVCENISFST